MKDITQREIDEMAACLIKWFKREPMTHHEIGTVFGLSRGWVSWVEQQGMAKIRAVLASEGYGVDERRRRGGR